MPARMLQSSKSLATFQLSSPSEADESLMNKTGRSLSGFFEKKRNVFKADERCLEIAIITLPVLTALASVPLASLVDTAFMGHIDPVELGAVGVFISVFNLVSKMFNLPLLNITTSLVAEGASGKEILTDLPLEPISPVLEGLFSAKVPSALVLGGTLGLGEALILAFLAGPILTVMGVNASSPMRLPAAQYLMWRAVGAPAVVIALAIQIVFRVAGNAVNIILDPILIFTLKLGVSGAAIATIISQYMILGWLLWVLSLEVILLPHKEDLRLGPFLKSGGYLLARTMAILLVMTLATSMAARRASTQMAGHQICLQIWLAASLPSDSIALAGQAIIATAFARFKYKRVKEASFRILQIGFVFGVFIAVLLGATMNAFSKVFTTDVYVFICLIPITMVFNYAGWNFNSTGQLVSIRLGWSSLWSVRLCLCSLFNDTDCSTFSCSTPCVTPLLGPSGGVDGINPCNEFTIGRWVLRIGTATGPWTFLKDDDVEKNVNFNS